MASGEDHLRGADDGLEHALVGVLARALGDLDDEGGLRLEAAAKEPHRLFGVVDVVGADGVFAIGVLEELGRGDDHRRADWRKQAGYPLPGSTHKCFFFQPAGGTGN